MYRRRQTSVTDQPPLHPIVPEPPLRGHSHWYIVVTTEGTEALNEGRGRSPGETKSLRLHICSSQVGSSPTSAIRLPRRMRIC